jgi:hypothetical protein
MTQCRNVCEVYASNLTHFEPASTTLSHNKHAYRVISCVVTHVTHFNAFIDHSSNRVTKVHEQLRLH